MVALFVPIYNLCSSPNIIRKIKYRTLGLCGYLTRAMEQQNINNFWLESLVEREK
jgi:hypothetical protein